MYSILANRFIAIVLLSSFCLAIGCGPPPQAAKKKKPQGILGKRTQDIGEWDPDAERTLRQEGGDNVNIINHQSQTLSYAIHETARLQVKRALSYFNAETGRYPESHEEFMEKVVKKYGVKLPQPVTTAEYQYDVENHELLVVEKKKE